MTAGDPPPYCPYNNYCSQNTYKDYTDNEKIIELLKKILEKLEEIRVEKEKDEKYL
jgi:hypothetical protein